jgi:hypothetical protein
MKADGLATRKFSLDHNSGSLLWPLVVRRDYGASTWDSLKIGVKELEGTWGQFFTL